LELSTALQLAALVESSEDAVIVLSLDGLIVTWSEGAERLFGYAQREVVGQPFTMLSPPNRREQTAALVTRMLAGGAVERTTTEHVAKDGAVLTVSLVISPINGSSQQSMGVAAIVRDRSAQSLTEGELQASEELYRSVVEALNDGVVLQDVDGRIIAANASAEAMLRLEGDDLIGRTSLLGGSAESSIVRLVHEDGTPFLESEQPASLSMTTGRPQMLKPGMLSGHELEEMKAHTTIGARILGDSGDPVLRMGREIALTHHERWDGSGYPAGMRGDAIPISGRIVAVAATCSMRSPTLARTSKPSRRSTRSRRSPRQAARSSIPRWSMRSSPVCPRCPGTPRRASRRPISPLAASRQIPRLEKDDGRRMEDLNPQLPSASDRRAWSLTEGSATITVALALVLFLGVFALREGDTNVGDAEGILYVIPIAFLALRFGLRSGLVGALTSFALIVAWDLHHPATAVTVTGYVTRGVAFLTLGVLLGRFVDQRRRLEVEVLRFHVAAEHQLADNAKWLEAEVSERTRELVEARAETLQRLAVAAEYHDDETAEHTKRVGVSAAEIATRIGFDAGQASLMGEAAPLHDVGKLAIPDRILLKRGRLSTEEFDVMKTHAALGARVLSGSSAPVLQMAAVIAASHHERWDGTGYPRGLAGKDIPLVGRVVAVADVFDALTHGRPYKPAWPADRALAEIRREAGRQFDPRVVAAFLALQIDTVTAPPQVLSV
jgi:PAS domain S-box-containing protein